MKTTRDLTQTNDMLYTVIYERPSVEIIEMEMEAGVLMGSLDEFEDGGEH